MNCNTAQNEVGGKDLLLKACKDLVVEADGPVAAALTLQGITLTAVTGGTGGNAITLALVDPSGNDEALSVGVAGNAITVSLATGSGGAITSTVTNIVTAINLSGPASALVTASGAGGTPVTAAGATNLTGGVAADNDLVCADHGLSVNDLVAFSEVGAITNIDVGIFYFVVAVASGTFRISATKGGSPITPDALEASLDVKAFISVGGIRSKSFGLAAEAVDITSGDSDEWRTILDGAGQRSSSVSGSGVFTNRPGFTLIEDSFFAKSLICLMFIDVKNSKIFEGCYKVTSLEISGEYNGEGSFSISAESSGAISRQAVE